jgi:hypothetical protein
MSPGTSPRPSRISADLRDDGPSDAVGSQGHLPLSIVLLMVHRKMPRSAIHCGRAAPDPWICSMLYEMVRKVARLTRRKASELPHNAELQNGTESPPEALAGRGILRRSQPTGFRFGLGSVTLSSMITPVPRQYAQNSTYGPLPKIPCPRMSGTAIQGASPNTVCAA